MKTIDFKVETLKIIEAQARFINSETGHDVYSRREILTLLNDLTGAIFAMEIEKPKIDFEILRDELTGAMSDVIKNQIDWEDVVELDLNRKQIEVTVDTGALIDELRGAIKDTIETAEQTLNEA